MFESKCKEDGLSNYLLTTMKEVTPALKKTFFIAVQLSIYCHNCPCFIMCLPIIAMVLITYSTYEIAWIERRLIKVCLLQLECNVHCCSSFL